MKKLLAMRLLWTGIVVLLASLAALAASASGATSKSKTASTGASITESAKTSKKPELHAGKSLGTHKDFHRLYSL